MAPTGTTIGDGALVQVLAGVMVQGQANHLLGMVGDSVMVLGWELALAQGLATVQGVVVLMAEAMDMEAVRELVGEEVEEQERGGEVAILVATAVALLGPRGDINSRG